MVESAADHKGAQTKRDADARPVVPKRAAAMDSATRTRRRATETFA